MKSILNKLNLLVLGTVLLLTFPGCSDDNTSDLKLDGDTWLTALELNDTYTGVIDRTNKTVTVAVPEVYDTDAMKVTGIEAWCEDHWCYQSLCNNRIGCRTDH